MTNRIPLWRSLFLPLGLLVVADVGLAQAPDRVAGRRGEAVAEARRPERFPHRIWAACDFEGQTPDYAWFGTRDTKNIVDYPGNATALAAQPGGFLRAIRGNLSGLRRQIHIGCGYALVRAGKRHPTGRTYPHDLLGL